VAINTDFCEKQLTKFCTVYTMKAIFFIVCMKHANMVTYNTILFLRKKLWPHYLGPPGAWGPSSLMIEPPETPVSTPLADDRHNTVTYHVGVGRGVAGGAIYLFIIYLLLRRSSNYIIHK